MAQVLEFEPVAAPAPGQETPSHRRIRWASRALSLLFAAIFVLDVLFVAALGSAFLVPYAGEHLTIGPKGMMLNFGPAQGGGLGYVPVGSLPLLQRLAHVAMGVVVFVPGLLLLWSLQRLFGLYGRGVVFSEANARLIKLIGVWLVLNALAPLVSVSVLSALHLVVDHAWFHADTIPKIVLGGVVYVIGMVMEVGRQIEEEQGQFV